MFSAIKLKTQTGVLPRKRMAKNKQKKMSKALVVYSQSAPNQQNKTKKKKSKTPKTNAQSSGLRAYRAALTAPFSLAAQGARVPDMYSCPTVTRHITKSFTVHTNSSGEADVVILPSAYFHAVSPRGSIPSGSVWTTLSGQTVDNAVIYTASSNLKTSLVNYRVVGYGIRVFGVASMTSTAGRCVISTLPISSFVNDKNATIGGQNANSTNASATVGHTLTTYGIPASANVVDLPSLPALPNSIELSMMSLSENQMIVTPKIVSPEAFMFNQSADNAIGFDVNDQTSINFVSSGDASYLRVSGLESVVIGVSGSTASSGVLEVEVIYHLEGTPTILNNNIVSDAPQTFCAPMDFLSTIAAVAKTPTFKQGLAAAGNSIYPGLGTLAMRFM